MFYLYLSNSKNDANSKIDANESVPPESSSSSWRGPPQFSGSSCWRCYPACQMPAHAWYKQPRHDRDRRARTIIDSGTAPALPPSPPRRVACGWRPPRMARYGSAGAPTAPPRGVGAAGAVGVGTVCASERGRACFAGGRRPLTPHPAPAATASRQSCAGSHGIAAVLRRQPRHRGRQCRHPHSGARASMTAR